jgi:hypothetical protein
MATGGALGLLAGTARIAPGGRYMEGEEERATDVIGGERLPG